MDPDDLYQERILDHYEQPFHRGSCPQATHAHEDSNPLCGDTIRMELRLDSDDRIADLYFQGRGCCISLAAASILVEHFQGKSLADLRSFSANEMLALFGPRLTITRQRCCLLGWRVLQAVTAVPLPGRPNQGDIDATSVSATPEGTPMQGGQQ
jgi:nitrogen fixation NifU-like protein